MTSLLGEIDRVLNNGDKAVLARIVRQDGSAPRHSGATMLIKEDGAISGTIGGGSIEYKVIQKAKTVLQDSKSHLMQFQLTGQEVAETEMICGGNADVYLEPLFPEDSHSKELFRNLYQLIADEKKGLLITKIENGAETIDNGGRLLVTEQGDMLGMLPDLQTDYLDQIKPWMNAGKPLLLELNEKKTLLFIEPIVPESTLFVFGAGHVAAQVVPLAMRVGFKTHVIDDREEFAHPDRFPSGTVLSVCPFPEAFTRLHINSSSFIVIVTRGHLFDKEVLSEALETSAAYIGMIGSTRKRNLIYQTLLEQGVSKSTLREVHSPIGCDIRAETSEEIAVSIVAELIQVRSEMRQSKSSDDLS